MTTHRRVNSIGSGLSVAYWSASPDRTLLLFVHGFMGSASSTWSDFPGLLPSRTHTKKADYVFFDYASYSSPLAANVTSLLVLLDSLGNDPAHLVALSTDEQISREPTFAYDHIYLIAHSLGAVVVRTALLKAIQQLSSGKTGYAWLSRVRLVLFAPAHQGVRRFGLLGARLTVGLNLPTYAALDLNANSNTIIALREATENAVASAHPAAKRLAAKLVVLAGKDGVVVKEPYPSDERSVTIPAAGHRDVCKPSQHFTQPIDLLCEVMK